MKIESTDKIQAATKHAPVQPKEKSGPGNFASVLEQKVAGSPPTAQGVMPPLSPPMPPIEAMRTITNLHAETADDLVDGLAQYQILLADPTASLRDMAPAVEKMKKISDDARKILETMAGDGPGKEILQEAVLLTVTEVERFNLGVYVEEVHLDRTTKG